MPPRQQPKNPAKSPPTPSNPPESDPVPRQTSNDQAPAAAMADPPSQIEAAIEEEVIEEVMAEELEEELEEVEELVEGEEEMGEGVEDEGGVEGEELAEAEAEAKETEVAKESAAAAAAAAKPEKRKQREYEVFVGGLPRDATEEDVKEVFKKVGEVVEVRLAKNAFTKKNKGFAFVRFATVDQAKRATVELKHTQVKGKSCGVIRSNDNETLHLGNICTTWTKNDLIEKLKVFELDNLEEVHLIEDPNKKGKNRGYAFLDFSTHMDAVAACSKLQKRDVFFGSDVRAEVSFSKTVEPDEEIMAHVRSVFVDRLPATWDEEQVKEQFKKFGEVESVQLARNMLSAKRKDFGFVCFATRQAALDCIEKVNKDGVGEGAEKVSVKATLRKPLPKRAPPMLGVRGRYIGKSFGMRRPEPYGSSRTFSGRPRPRELPSKAVSGGLRDRARFSTRGDAARSTISPSIGRSGARPRREFVRDIPGSSSSSRSRDPYIQSSVTGGRVVGSYEDPSSGYSHRSGRYADDLYADDIYSSHFDRRESYEYPAASGYKRSYSDMDHDMLAPSSLARQSRSRPGLDMEGYHFDRRESYEYPAASGYKRSYSDMDDDMLAPSSLASQSRSRPGLDMEGYGRTSASAYDDYSRYLPEERMGYDRLEPEDRGYRSRNMAGNTASRSYY